MPDFRSDILGRRGVTDTSLFVMLAWDIEQILNLILFFFVIWVLLVVETTLCFGFRLFRDILIADSNTFVSCEPNRRC